ncbi:MAG: flagellar hook capping FlgD N-terminal domain-containing protein [Planctomycetota bacterium]
MNGISSSTATNDFLHLLTIQLTNQDPIEPIKQEEFTAQLTQISMLEQLESMTGSFDSLLRVDQETQGIELVGKEASYTDPFTGERKSGTVEETLTEDGPVTLVINGERVLLDLISGVKAS